MIESGRPVEPEKEEFTILGTSLHIPLDLLWSRTWDM